jgi:catechol 2,3-dioxygenase-like lactoylglutathione lyase family enzyme
MAFAATTGVDAALRFYRDALGLRFVADDGFALVFDAAGTTLRVARVEHVEPAPYTVLGWAVANIEDSVRELTGNGVAFEHYDSVPQDELGICTFPGSARVAWFKDPDGNLLSLTQVL